jgi:putative transposase
MLANDLLLGKMIRTAGKRDFVQFRRIEATKPLEYLWRFAAAMGY